MTLLPGTRDPVGTGLTPARLAAAGAVVLTVGVGLGLRAVATGSVAKYGGDALYAVLVLALVVLAVPRVRPVRAAAGALATSWAVEFLQLTPVPAELSRHSTLARLVLGSTFNPPDLFWYAVGAAAGWLVHIAARPLLVSGRRRAPGG
ncbi:ribosomal maturation YjgA family protein [Streptomyces sp. NBC_00435]|uniref:ribosomal maturation YjgA family protein n=1 Tax=Streptomyces sp. NBC_00435 TaxID=2903649 RepID=UPI003FA7546F